MFNSKRRILIASTGRAGSTFVSRLVARIEPELDFEHQLPGSRRINILGNLTAQGLVPRTFIANSTLRSNRALLGGSTGDPLRSMLLASAILYGDQLLVDRENFRVVHLVRDPRTFATSFMNWGRARIRRRFLHYVLPFWQPSPRMDQSSWLRGWGMSKLEQYAWIWTFKNSFFMQLKDRVPYRRYLMEELLRPDDVSVLREALQFMGVPMSDPLPDVQEESKNRSAERSFPHWRQWSPSQARKVDRHAGPLMRELGYGAEPEWLALLDGSNETSTER